MKIHRVVGRRKLPQYEAVRDGQIVVPVRITAVYVDGRWVALSNAVSVWPNDGVVVTLP